MARKRPRPNASVQQSLVPQRLTCWQCGGTLWMAYHSVRTITTLDGLCQLLLTIRRCHNPKCPRYHQPYRPEEEGRWALPHGEFGLDIIALIGMLRYEMHRSVPEIHQELCKRGVVVAERTVTNLLARYEELVSLRLSDQARVRERLTAQGQVILALDGLQPDVGHEVLWVLRDCLSGEVLLARSLLSASETDLAVLLREVQHPFLCQFTASSLMDNIPSATPFARRCQMCPISYATFITSVKRPNRCMKRIAMPKRNSKSTFVAFAQLSGRLNAVRIRKQKLFAAIVWRSAVLSRTMDDHRSAHLG